MIFYIIAALALAVAHTGSAQAPSVDETLLERLALQAAIDRAEWLKIRPGVSRIVIDPMIVRANEAPGARDSVERSPLSHAALVAFFQGRSAPRLSVIDCNRRPCRLRDADLLVMLAKPSIQDTKASVTVTLTYPGRRHHDYETVNVLFERQGAAWKVVGFQQLGIS